MSYDDVLDEVKKKKIYETISLYLFILFFQIGEVGKFQYIAIGKLYTY